MADLEKQRSGADPKKTLKQLHSNLNILQEREVKYGGNAPIELLNQIDDHQHAIKLTEQYLNQDLTEADWREALKPVLEAVGDDQGSNSLVETSDPRQQQISSQLIGSEPEITEQAEATQNRLFEEIEPGAVKKGAAPPDDEKREWGTPLGNRLRALRNSAGLSQSKLSERLGEVGLSFHRRTISHYETSLDLPTRSKLADLIEGLVKLGLLSSEIDANEFLELANYPPLSEDEVGHIFPEKRPELQPRFDITTHALSDAPTTHDLLGFEVYAEALVKFIEDPNTDKPLTIAIDAPWGMGKSSLMRMIEQRLAWPGQDITKTQGQDELNANQKNKQRASFPTVWFNAWQYDQSEAIWANLVLEILKQVQARMTFRERLGLTISLTRKRFDSETLIQNIVRYLLLYTLPIVLLGLIILLVTLLSAGVKVFWENTLTYVTVVGLGGGASLIFALGKEAYDKLTQPFSLKLDEYIRQPDYLDKAGFLTQFKDDFERVVDVLTHTDQGRWPLIIFIDDLDRCEPPKPVDIVEAINLLLNSKHCVFIIGMDVRTVAGSIEAKYRDMLEFLDSPGPPGRLSFGHQFLEKIVQIRFRIPRTTSVKFEEFIKKHLIVSEEEDRSSEVEEESKPSTITEKIGQILARLKPGRREPEKAVAQTMDVTQRRHIEAQAEAQLKALQRARPQSLDEAAGALQATFDPETVAVAREQVASDEALFDRNEDVQQTVIEAASYLGFNPRQIKRFINLYRLQAYIAQKRNLPERDDFELELLGKWLLVSQLWPHIISAIRQDDTFFKRLAETVELQKRVEALQKIPPEKMLATEKEDFDELSPLLESHREDPLIATLIEDRVFKKLLDKLKDSRNVRQYLDLTEISVRAEEAA